MFVLTRISQLYHRSHEVLNFKKCSNLLSDFRLVYNKALNGSICILGHLNDLRVLYSQNKTPATSTKKNARHIPQIPERILDAPDLIDDYCKLSSVIVPPRETSPAKSEEKRLFSQASYRKIPKISPSSVKAPPNIGPPPQKKPSVKSPLQI